MSENTLSYVLPAPGTFPVKGTVTGATGVLDLATKYPGTTTIAVVGDLLGDMENARKALTTVGVATFPSDGEPAWTGGTTILIVTGNFVGPGPDPMKLALMLLSLDIQARRAKGAIILLMGPHEMLTLAENAEYYAQYVSDAELLHYAKPADLTATKTAKHNKEYTEESLKALRQQMPPSATGTPSKLHFLDEYLGDAKEAQKLRDKLRAARKNEFQPFQPASIRLHSMPLVVLVGPYAFSYNVFPMDLARFGVANINKSHYHQWRSYLAARGKLASKKQKRKSKETTEESSSVPASLLYADVASLEKVPDVACDEVDSLISALAGPHASDTIKHWIVGQAGSPTQRVRNVCKSGKLLSTDTGISRWSPNAAHGIGGLVINLVTGEIKAVYEGSPEEVLVAGGSSVRISATTES